MTVATSLLQRDVGADVGGDDEIILFGFPGGADAEADDEDDIVSGECNCVRPPPRDQLVRHAIVELSDSASSAEVSVFRGLMPNVREETVIIDEDIGQCGSSSGWIFRLLSCNSCSSRVEQGTGLCASSGLGKVSRGPCALPRQQTPESNLDSEEDCPDVTLSFCSAPAKVLFGWPFLVTVLVQNAASGKHVARHRVRIDIAVGTGRLKGRLSSTTGVDGQASFQNLLYAGPGVLQLRVLSECGEQALGNRIVVEKTSDQLAAERAVGSAEVLERLWLALDDVLLPCSAVPSEASEVADWLLIGGKSAARNACDSNTARVTHVLNCIEPWKAAGPGANELCYAGFHGVDELGYRFLDRHYATNIRPALDAARLSGGRCLVHCAKGVNRSALAAAAYLVEVLRMDVLPAVTLLKAKRGNVLCNPSFKMQLIEFAAQLGRLGHL